MLGQLSTFQSKRDCLPLHAVHLCCRLARREIRPCLPVPCRQETRQVPSKASGHQPSQQAARIYPTLLAGFGGNPPRFPGPGRTCQTATDQAPAVKQRSLWSIGLLFVMSRVGERGGAGDTGFAKRKTTDSPQSAFLPCCLQKHQLNRGPSYQKRNSFSLCSCRWIRSYNNWRS